MLLLLRQNGAVRAELSRAVLPRILGGPKGTLNTWLVLVTVLIIIQKSSGIHQKCLCLRVGPAARAARTQVTQLIFEVKRGPKGSAIRKSTTQHLPTQCCMQPAIDDLHSDYVILLSKLLEFACNPAHIRLLLPRKNLSDQKASCPSHDIAIYQPVENGCCWRWTSRKIPVPYS